MSVPVPVPPDVVNVIGEPIFPLKVVFEIVKAAWLCDAEKITEADWANVYETSDSLIAKTVQERLVAIVRTAPLMTQFDPNVL